MHTTCLLAIREKVKRWEKIKREKILKKMTKSRRATNSCWHHQRAVFQVKRNNESVWYCWSTFFSRSLNILIMWIFFYHHRWWWKSDRNYFVQRNEVEINLFNFIHQYAHLLLLFDLNPKICQSDIYNIQKMFY